MNQTRASIDVSIRIYFDLVSWFKKKISVVEYVIDYHPVHKQVFSHDRSMECNIEKRSNETVSKARRFGALQPHRKLRHDSERFFRLQQDMPKAEMGSHSTHPNGVKKHRPHTPFQLAA